MFTEQFREMLQKKNLTAYRIAKNTGISQGLMAEYNKGDKIPTVQNLVKIADYLDCSVDYLLGRTDTPEVSTSQEPKTRRKHDQADVSGFNIDPELLAHDLALLKLSREVNISKLTEPELYDVYIKLMDTMERVIDDRIRFDEPCPPSWFSPSSSPLDSSPLSEDSSDKEHMGLSHTNDF